MQDRVKHMPMVLSALFMESQGFRMLMVACRQRPMRKKILLDVRIAKFIESSERVYASKIRIQYRWIAAVSQA